MGIPGKRGFFYGKKRFARMFEKCFTGNGMYKGMRDTYGDFLLTFP